jgi:hypothetical protein
MITSKDYQNKAMTLDHMETKTVSVCAKMTPELRERVRQACREEGITLAEAIRRQLTEWVDRGD